jgi:hypothetical protein
MVVTNGELFEEDNELQVPKGERTFWPAQLVLTSEECFFIVTTFEFPSYCLVCHGWKRTDEQATE